jgi:hypothetical protein
VLLNKLFGQTPSDKLWVPKLMKSDAM